MYKRAQERLGVREYAAIVMMCIGIKPTDSTPTLLYKIGKEAAWMIPVISGIILFISLFMLLKLIKAFKDKGLMDIVFIVSGKYMGFIIGMIIAITVIAFSAINTRSYVDIMSDIYFLQTPRNVLYLILIASSAALASMGIEAIGRTSWLMMPYIIGIVIFFIVLIWDLLQPSFIFPLWGPGIKTLIKGGVLQSSIFTEIIVFSIFFKNMRDYKSFKNASIGIGIYLVFEISLFMALFMMVLDYPPAIIVNYPFHTIARLIYTGRFVSNLEAFFLLFWIICSILRFSMYIYTAAAYITYSLKLTNIKKLILPIAGIIMMVGLIPENFFTIIDVSRKFLLNISWMFVYPLPVVLFFIHKMKGSKEA